MRLSPPTHTDVTHVRNHKEEHHLTRGTPLPQTTAHTRAMGPWLPTLRRPTRQLAVCAVMPPNNALQHHHQLNTNTELRACALRGAAPSTRHPQTLPLITTYPYPHLAPIRATLKLTSNTLRPVAVVVGCICHASPEHVP